IAPEGVADFRRQLFVNHAPRFGNYFAGGGVYDVFAERVPDELVLFRGQAVIDPPVGRLDKAKFIDLRIRRQATDQTDVRTFGCFDGADAPIVRIVHVAHVKARALAAQTAGA